MKWIHNYLQKLIFILHINCVLQRYNLHMDDFEELLLALAGIIWHGDCIFKKIPEVKW